MNFRKKSKLRQNSYAKITGLFLLLIILNMFFADKPIRVDLTEEGLYSLSGTTKKLLSNLDDVVTVNCFFSKELPPAYMAVAEKIRDLLNEYSAYSDGKLSVSFIDPVDNPEYRQLAASVGVPVIQMNILDRENFELIKGYLGIGIFYEDKQTSIPVVNNITNLEYELTAAIKRLTTHKLPTIRVALYGNEHDSNIIKKFSSLYENLEKQASFGMTDLSINDIPDETDLLFVLYPKGLNQLMRFRIDQYLAKGGRVIFLPQLLEPSENMYALMVDHGLEEILSGLGFSSQFKLVSDRCCATASFNNGYVEFSVPYNLFVKVLPVNFNHSLPVFNRISSITLPWITELSPIDKIMPEQASSVVTSSEYCSLLNGYNLDPQQNFHISEKAGNGKILGVHFNGLYKSMFEKGPNNELMALLRMNAPDLKTEEVSITKNNQDARAIVIPNALFLADDFTKRHQGNLAFMLNIADWLTLGEDLIQIRAKMVSDRPLFSRKKFRYLHAAGNEGKLAKMRFYIKYLNILLPSLFIVVLGLARHIAREQKRVNYEKKGNRDTK